MRSLLAGAVALVCALAMWYYVTAILVPQQVVSAAGQAAPRGNLSDLYPRWYGGRELLLHGRDPYSAAVTREIQAGYYGRPLDPTRPGDPTDQQAFAYPVYVAFLLWPAFALPFAAVQAGFTWLLLALTAATVLLWLRAIGWHPPAAVALAAVLLTLGSFQAIQGLELQQLSLLVAALLAGAAAALAGGRPVLAGVLLALATVKPQLAAPLLAWLAVWATGDWRRRQGLVWACAGTLALLLAGAEWVAPGWIPRFVAALAAYQQYHGETSVISTLLAPLGDPAGPVASALVVAGLLIALAALAWRQRRAPAATPGFALVLALTLAVTLLIIPTRSPYNHVLLLPALLLLPAGRARIVAAGRPGRYSLLVAGVLVAWPWGAALGLALAALVLPAARVQSQWTLPLWTILFIPLGVPLALAVAARPLLAPVPTEAPP